MNGYSHKAVISVELVRGRNYIDFNYRDNSGLIAEGFLFYFSEGYKLNQIVLTRDEIIVLFCSHWSHSIKISVCSGQSFYRYRLFPRNECELTFNLSLIFVNLLGVII